MTDFDLGGGGGSAFSFGKQGDQPGTYVQGTVLDMKEVQKTNFKTNEPEFWDNGDPKMQYRVTLQTELRDPTNPNDDGKRDVYLDGRRKPNDNGTKSRLCAVLDAVREVTGSTSLQYGGKLTLQWISGMGFEGDPRNYAAWYEAPAFSMEQPPEHASPPPMPPAQHPSQLQSPGAPPAWAQQQAPAAPPVQQQFQAPPAPPQVTPAVAAANPMAPPVAPPAQQPTAFAQAVQPDLVQMAAAQQQALAQAGAPVGQPQVIAVEPAVQPNALAGTVGQPITAEQVAGLQALNVDPATVFGADWQTRVIG